MYQPSHLASFLRLLITHFGNVIDECERLGGFYTDQAHMDALLRAIDSGDPQALAACRDQRREYEALFVLQMSQAREWVERLGMLDRMVERQSDEFLVATLPIETLLQDRDDHQNDYSRVNQLIKGDASEMLKGDLRSYIDIESIMLAIFEFLGRIEEEYHLIGDLISEEEIAELLPVSKPAASAHGESAQIIPLFGGDRLKKLRQRQESMLKATNTN